MNIVEKIKSYETPVSSVLYPGHVYRAIQVPDYSSQGGIVMLCIAGTVGEHNIDEFILINVFNGSRAVTTHKGKLPREWIVRDITEDAELVVEV